jgi:hypothetical protein
LLDLVPVLESSPSPSTLHLHQQSAISNQHAALYSVSPSTLHLHQQSAISNQYAAAL